MHLEVSTHIYNQLAIFELKREKALNSLTHEMIKKIHRYAYAWQQQHDVACYVFPPLQGKVYCAGGDIRWLYDQGKAGNHDAQMAFFADEYRLDNAIGESKKPVIATIDGFLIGGGMGLIMPAKTIYASDTAMFSMPETGIGFFPDVGMSFYLNQCPGQVGLYLALTGQRFNAFEAHYLGLIDGVVSQENIQSTYEYARQQQSEPNLYEAIVNQLSGYNISKSDMPIVENETMINDVFGLSSVEAILAKLSGMSEPWAEQALTQMQKACPLSLKVTFELMRRTKGKDAVFAYQLDYVVARHFMESFDFYEGVRALIVDKDKSPKWQYAQVEDVSQSVVDGFFVSSQPDLTMAYEPYQFNPEEA